MTRTPTLHSFFYIWKLLYMFRVVLPPIIRSAYNCIYSIWYLSHCYCYLPLSWKSWNRVECAVGALVNKNIKFKELSLLLCLAVSLGKYLPIFRRYFDSLNSRKLPNDNLTSDNTSVFRNSSQNVRRRWMKILSYFSQIRHAAFTLFSLFRHTLFCCIYYS
jgi:hypothetical protein